MTREASNCDIVHAIYCGQTHNAEILGRDEFLLSKKNNNADKRRLS